MMKLEISIVLLLCTWTTLGEEFSKLRYFGMDMEEKLNALINEVRELKRAKIAFSATLSASWDSVYFGPHEEATTLVYENVFTNIGNAYDKNTGIFTAPVKGVYFFNYVVFNAGEKPTGVKLLKNGNLVLAALDNAPGQDTEDTTSNSVSLILEQGDQIKLQLLESRRIYTDAWRRNTFSGHLLFTL
ncbi:cerebellin-2-like isoform X1 [Labeo rohita]|uniref:cerebellin-2-like isoform X1 n=1 Tax=Labeo rohita TaxID=84645 RepID=UPI0021E28155|nr:cerebellin-2-like isoform X1 [Labeo rohita]